eukprot:1185517-Prorocentrum_minimum.AAC.1
MKGLCTDQPAGDPWLPGRCDAVVTPLYCRSRPSLLERRQQEHNGLEARVPSRNDDSLGANEGRRLVSFRNPRGKMQSGGVRGVAALFKMENHSLATKARAKAAVLGAFVADAATMPLHWVRSRCFGAYTYACAGLARAAVVFICVHTAHDHRGGTERCPLYVDAQTYRARMKWLLLSRTSQRPLHRQCRGMIYDTNQLDHLIQSRQPEFFDPPSCPFYEVPPTDLEVYT